MKATYYLNPGGLYWQVVELPGDRFVRTDLATKADLEAACRVERRGSRRRIWVEGILALYGDQLDAGVTLGDLFAAGPVEPTADAAIRGELLFRYQVAPRSTP